MGFLGLSRKWWKSRLGSCSNYWVARNGVVWNKQTTKLDLLNYEYFRSVNYKRTRSTTNTPMTTYKNAIGYEGNGVNTIRADSVRFSTGRKRRGWPGGRHASPTELKMRSGITTISVNFPTFPANQSFRPTAESMRPRAKSFIRPISQIEANRQKFSLSMTSEVRKCPKSAKSDRNSGCFRSGRRARGGNLLQCINEMCAWIRRLEVACTEWPPMRSSPSFLRNNDFFSKVDISFEE